MRGLGVAMQGEIGTAACDEDRAGFVGEVELGGGGEPLGAGKVGDVEDEGGGLGAEAGPPVVCMVAGSKMAFWLTAVPVVPVRMFSSRVGSREGPV